MKKSIFVARDDGHTITRYIEERPQCYPDLTFEVRPTSPDERARFVDFVQGCSEVQANERARAFMMTKLISWDAVDAKGAQAPVSITAMAEMHPIQFQRLRAIVCFCSEGGDPVPGASAESSKELEVAFSEWLEKNSQKASPLPSSTQE